MGAAAPRPAATAAGSMKMPAPMVVLTMLAVRERMAKARTSARSGETCMGRDCTSSLPRSGRAEAGRGFGGRRRNNACVNRGSTASKGESGMAISSLKDFYFDELSDLYDAELQM